MALRRKVLRIKAEKFERKQLLNYTLKPEAVSVLDLLLENVYTVLRPKPSDYDVRKDLVRVFNEIAKEIYGNSSDAPVVKEFGSFVMDLFSTNSDLDLSVNFCNSGAEITRQKKIQTLRKFARKFYALQSKGHVCGVHPITTAKVPILKVVDRGTGVECDLSIENKDGISKSHIIHLICSLDERFQKLSFLMKAWAKAQNINSSKDGTLNSLSIILMVAFHLQTRNPPILPPFSALLKDGMDPASVVKLLRNFMNFGRSNKESVAELFVTLLIKLASMKNLWAKGLCVSTFEGSWTSKTWDSKVASISVEDFTDRSQNVARAVCAAEMIRINKCIQRCIQHISAFMNGSIEESGLMQSLFGQHSMLLLANTGILRLKPNAAHHLNANVAQPRIPPKVNQTNGVQVFNNWEGKQQLQASDPISAKRGMPSGSWEQMQQAFPFDSASTKRMRCPEGWGSNTAGSWDAPPYVNLWGSQVPAHLDLSKGQQNTEVMGVARAEGWGDWGGRGRTQQPYAGGWNGMW